jgi:hypothetical protein
MVAFIKIPCVGWNDVADSLRFTAMNVPSSHALQTRHKGHKHHGCGGGFATQTPCFVGKLTKPRKRWLQLNFWKKTFVNQLFLVRNTVPEKHGTEAAMSRVRGLEVLPMREPDNKTNGHVRLTRSRLRNHVFLTIPEWSF